MRSIQFPLALELRLHVNQLIPSYIPSLYLSIRPFIQNLPLIKPSTCVLLQQSSQPPRSQHLSLLRPMDSHPSLPQPEIKTSLLDLHLPFNGKPELLQPLRPSQSVFSRVLLQDFLKLDPSSLVRCLYSRSQN
jgi:hypothetical protein